MKKVILTTVFTGYNYGSSLQALAGKITLQELGYDCQLIAQKSLVKGRDIRLCKLFTILTRSLLIRGKSGSKSLSTYQKSYNKKMIGDSVARFAKFTEIYLKPKYLTWGAMMKEAHEAVACFAGSDQIWNSSTMYVDPIYYLRFAPQEKRVALAPSFGRDFIANYNKEKMSKWISEFAHISIREDSGVQLIKEMTGRNATHLVDPTLMVDGNTWRQTLAIQKKDSNYILAYFLDKPSDSARNAIQLLKDVLKCEVIAIPYQFEDMNYCNRIVPTGPREFLELIDNAKCVLTDSFHGTAFSINLETPFYVFGRDYGTAHSQNSRVESLLKKVDMEGRFEPKNVINELYSINYGVSNKILTLERQKAKEYLMNSLGI